MAAEEYLALDIGLKRTGIARASSIARLPEALKVVPTAQLLEELKSLTAEMTIAAIVVGLPRNLSGQDTAQTAWIRQWVDQAKQQVPLPFYWQDEALTTVAARRAQPDKAAVDAEAAAIILQDYLNEKD